MSDPALSTVLPDPDRPELPKASQVQQMFDRIAGTYDLLNDCISLGFHRRWKRQACARLQLAPGDHVLDVCTGTGDLIGYLLPHVGETGRVTGLDFSEQMLAVARQRFAADGRVHLVQGDALQLPFEDNTFDGAIISFGLRNVTDIPRALAEMHRVIKPGGWMINLDTCPVPKIPGVRFYFTTVMPMIGRLLSRDEGAYRYLSESTRHFLTPQSLQRQFETVGCQSVACRTLMLGSVSMQAGQKAASPLTVDPAGEATVSGL